MKARPPSRRSKGGGAVISVRVQPRASKSGITPMEDGSYKVRLTAPPVDGAANEALVELLARALKVGKTAVSIVSGHTGRDKRISLEGLGLEEIKRLLNIGNK